MQKNIEKVTKKRFSIEMFSTLPKAKFLNLDIN